MNEQELQRQLKQLAEAAVPPGLADRLAGALSAGTPAVRPLPGVPVRTLILFSLLALAAGLGFLAGGKGWRALDAGQRLSLALVLVLPAVWFAWELSLRMVPAARLYTTGALAAAVTVAAAAGWAWWFTPVRTGSKLFYVICVGFTTAGVAVSLWLTRWWLRRGFPASRGFSWPMAGAAGVAGFAAVQLFCPYVDMTHIVTSHVVPAVLAGLAAARLAGAGRKTVG